MSSSFCCFLPASSACCSIFWCRDWSYSTKETMGWRDARDTQTKERRSRQGWLPPDDASASLLASFSCEQLPSPALKTQHNGNTFKTLNLCMQLRMYVRTYHGNGGYTYIYLHPHSQGLHLFIIRSLSDEVRRYVNFSHKIHVQLRTSNIRTYVFVRM